MFFFANSTSSHNLSITYFSYLVQPLNKSIIQIEKFIDAYDIQKNPEIFSQYEQIIKNHLLLSPIMYIEGVSPELRKWQTSWIQSATLEEIDMVFKYLVEDWLSMAEFRNLVHKEELLLISEIIKSGRKEELLLNIEFMSLGLNGKIIWLMKCTAKKILPSFVIDFLNKFRRR